MQDSQGRVRGGGQGQVPPGGSHHGTVQTPECGHFVWSGVKRRTSELFLVAAGLSIAHVHPHLH